jgi:ferrous iron transport protein B
MITALLFPHRPLVAAAVFTGAYLLGVLAALGMAGLFKRTILPGESRPLAIELPSYKIPSLRNALLTVFDRGWIFVRKAGTVILLFSIALWALANYPRSEMPPEAQALIGQAGQLRASGSSAEADSLVAQARSIEQQQRLSHSAAGRLGRAIEPVLRPLGFDWQIGVGIVSSFAAREVIVSTLAIVYGVGDENGATSLQATLGAARRPDGTRVFTLATCLSLLTFYVLAMQCIPTQAIARRETGGWRWPLFQFGYMTALAYVASLTVYQVVSRLV